MIFLVVRKFEIFVEYLKFPGQPINPKSFRMISKLWEKKESTHCELWLKD